MAANQVSNNSAVAPERIRNVVLLGHSGSGKTSLVEALLNRAKVTARAGRVDDGTSICDFEPEEQKRKMSLSTALAPFDWSAENGTQYRINLLDTPGYADFTGEVEAALRVADLAVIVVSAVDGIEVQTEYLWSRCADLGMPRLVFVNKEDKERADFHRVLHDLRTAFGSGIAPLELPLGEQSNLHGVADLLHEEAHEYGRDGTHRVEPLPTDIVEEEHALHEQLVEEIVAGDDAQLERYLGGEVPSIDELERSLAHEVSDNLEYPVLLGSALTGVGIDRLAEFICALGPSPVDRGGVAVTAGPAEVTVRPDPNGEPLAFVFKTIADPYVGQLSLFKVLSGTIRVDDHLMNPTTGTDERMHGLFQLRGKEQTPVTRVVAGDIAAVAKLANTSTGHTLAPKGTPVTCEPIPRPPAVLSVAIRARTQADDDKLGIAIQRLQAEDTALVLTRDPETHQMLLSGTGETHLAVTLERLSRKFGISIDTEDVKVPYRETIAGTAEAEGKLKKQSGGHGQFAVANLRVAPLPRGEQFVFVDKIVGGAIPRQYVAAVQKGVEETMAVGGVHGFRVVDVQVECFDGKFHSVDSSEMAFKTAAALGFKEALSRAGSIVLEPVSKLRVRVPTAFQGDVLGDINARRGRVHGTVTTDDGGQETIAYVPTAELLRYAVDLRSMTRGRGSFAVEHDHYDVLPGNLVERAKASRVSAGDHA
jgi:elongation factor G